MSEYEQIYIKQKFFLVCEVDLSFFWIIMPMGGDELQYILCSGPGQQFGHI